MLAFEVSFNVNQSMMMCEEDVTNELSKEMDDCCSLARNLEDKLDFVQKSSFLHACYIASRIMARSVFV